MNCRTILAFDFGLSNIGVAVGQELTQSASPLIAISAQKGEPQWQRLDPLIKEWQPALLVVGIPFTLTKEALYTTKLAQEFADKLGTRYNIEVQHQEEQLTTKEAKAMLFDRGGYRRLKKDNIDNLSATIILQSWFNENNSY